MGGCRCTYRTCTSRSDGKTHMFHYPVFDKVRCHQWLTNAHKLEFLNLKVSQLKNRVVCQHHFNDENFMNFKKNKLTFNAVPTKNGPHCENSMSVSEREKDGKLYAITLEDIENEYMTSNDKKANFSVKYGDFLTNCDIMDLDSLSHNENTQLETKDKIVDEYNIILNDNIDRNMSDLVIVSKTRDMKRQEKEHNTAENIEIITQDKPTNARDEFEKLIADTVNENQQNTEHHYGASEVTQGANTKQNAISKPEPKVKIISTQKFTKPIPLRGKVLEPIKPSILLPLPKKKTIIKPNVVETNDMKDAMIEISIDKQLENKQLKTKQLENKQLEDHVEVPWKPIDKDNGKEIKSLLPRVKKQIVLNTTNEIPTKMNKHIIYNTNNEKTTKRLLNNKMNNGMSPERMATIQRKRKFNMKLRDIIESCLDKIDDQEKIDENTKYMETLKRKQSQSQQVAQHLYSDPKLAHIDNNTLLYLEERMQKMENKLLDKISQNSTRIIDLKRTFSPHTQKRTVHTQTSVNEKLHKKHLYQEISKYLSPDANNMIYEELFINRYVPDSTRLGKRRKCI